MESRRRESGRKECCKVLAACLSAAYALFSPARAVAQGDPEFVISYAVFYTPEALSNEENGTPEAMLAKINLAFEGANTIFRDSNTGVQLRLVAVAQLSRSNSAPDLGTIVSELSPLPEVLETMRTSGADSYAFMVEHLTEGAYGGIPISIRQARRGGSTFFGRRNFSGFTFAHETGHTLGAFHDRPEDALPAANPWEAPFANHFIGQSGQHYRTVMSVKLNSYRAPEGVVIPTVQSNRFSSPTLFFDGVPTGIAGERDDVSVIRYYAPYVSQAWEFRYPSPNPGDPPPDDGNPPNDPPDGGDDDDSDPRSDDVLPVVAPLGDPARSGRSIVVNVSCRYSDDGSPAEGKELSLTMRDDGKRKRLRHATCSAAGEASFRFPRRKYGRGMKIEYDLHPSVKLRVPFLRALLRR